MQVLVVDSASATVEDVKSLDVNGHKSARSGARLISQQTWLDISLANRQ